LSVTSAAVDVERLSRRFGLRAALDEASLRVEPGEVVGLLGPNGSGKTTLFRILATLLAPSGGTARIFGFDVVREAHAARRCFGVVFQNPSLDKMLTAAENLRCQGRLYGVSGAALAERSQQLLTRLALWDRRDDRIAAFSGGMARRVEIAKGLLHRPGLLLLDEPSTGLDPGARRDLWDLLDELRRGESMTILFTTHLMEEADRADRLAILDRGRVVAAGAPESLKSAVGGDVIRIRTGEPAALRDEIAARFGATVTISDGQLRIERPRGHEFIPQLIEAFPGRIEAASVGKPTLEDVFIRATGHGLYGTEGAA